MNVYDFDKTIYDGDCTLDFWKFCVLHHPSALAPLPIVIVIGVAYRCGFCGKEKFKEIFYRFLRYVPDVESEIQLFWDIHFKKIREWYFRQRKASDLVISASPDFLIAEVCRRLEIRYIASKVNPLTGKLESKNCYGAEKVKRFVAEYPEEKIERFYSDSKSDEPLANLAAYAYLIKKACIITWNSE